MTVRTEQQSADAVTVSRVDWAPVPRVNLLPPEIVDARGFRKVQVRLSAAVLVTLLAAAGGTIWAQGQVGTAQSALDVTTAQTSVLHRQEAQYAEVPRVTSALATARTARETSMAQDLLWYRLMSDIALATPSNVWLTTMNVTLTSAGSTAKVGSSTSGATGDPLLPTGIGTVTITGTAASYPDVAAWLEAVVRIHGLDGSTLQTATRASSTGSAGQLQFTSQIVVLPSVLSHRYDRKAG
jgi:Tfp pilus assembly protein PilN